MKRWMSLLAVILGGTALFSALFAMNQSFSVRVGRCVMENTGSCFLVLDDAPVVMSEKGIGKNPWMRLESGEELLVVHGGIAVSYPG